MSDDEFDLDFVSNASKKVHDNWNKSIELGSKSVEVSSKKDSENVKIVTENLSPSPVKRSKEDKENQESNSKVVSAVSLTPPSSPGGTPKSAGRAVRGANRTKKTQQALNKILSNTKRSVRRGVASADTSLVGDVSLVVSDDEEDGLELKVRWKVEIIRVEVKQNEKMGKIADRLAGKVGLSAGDVNLYHNGVSVPRDSTVSDLQLSVVSVLEGRARVTGGQGDDQVVSDKLEVKLQTKDRRAQPVVLDIRPTDTMGSVMERFLEVSKITSRDKVKFYFDGELLNEGDTAEDLELEGGECIDVHILS